MPLGQRPPHKQAKGEYERSLERTTEYDGEMRLALRRIADIRLQLEIERDVVKLQRLADAVCISASACVESAERFRTLEEERKMLND